MYLLPKHDTLISLNSKGKKNLFILRLPKFTLIFFVGMFMNNVFCHGNLATKGNLILKWAKLSV